MRPDRTSPIPQDGEEWEGYAIIGFTPHRELAPFENARWKKAGLNDLYHELPVVPNEQLEWFQLHHFKEGRPVDSAIDLSGGPHHPRDATYVDWLRNKSAEIPLYTLGDWPEVPDGIPYPKKEVYKHFGSNYFTNSISFMIGIAIMRGFKKIGVYGVDMMTAGGRGSEYGYQRPSCEMLLGWAMCKLGPENVIIPEESDLLAAAYDYADEHGSRFRVKMEHENEERQKRLNGVRGQKNQCALAEAELVGATNANERWMRGWMPGDNRPPNPGRAPDANAHKTTSGNVCLDPSSLMARSRWGGSVPRAHRLNGSPFPSRWTASGLFWMCHPARSGAISRERSAPQAPK